MVLYWTFFVCVTSIITLDKSNALIKDPETSQQHPKLVQDNSSAVLRAKEYKGIQLVVENEVDRNVSESTNMVDLPKIKQKDSGIQDPIKRDKLTPYLVYPESFPEERRCVVRNSTTSFRIDGSSQFAIDEGARHINSSDSTILNCSIIIKKAVPSICKLHLQFHEFENENSRVMNDDAQVCENSGIEVRGNVKQKYKICGNLTAKSQVLPFGENDTSIELYLTYLHQNFPPLFNFTVRQINCPETKLFENEEVQDISNSLLKDSLGIQGRSPVERASNPDCNRVIQKEEFVLQSPNYPSKYQNNIDCTTIVYPSSDSICALGN